MTFRDRSYCASDCSNIMCSRNLSEDVIAAARRWWGKEGAPILMTAELRKDCKDYVGRLVA